MVDARFGAGSLQPGQALVGCTEQAEGITNLRRLGVADVLRYEVIGQVDASLPQPVQVGSAGILEIGLVRPEPLLRKAPRSRAVFRYGGRGNKDCLEAVQGTSCPGRAHFKAAPGRLHRPGMEAHQQQGAVGHLSGQFHHPRPGGGHEHGSWRIAHVAKPRLHAVELHPFPTQQAADGQDGVSHGCHRGPGPTNVAHRQVAWSNGQPRPPRHNFLQRMGQRRQHHGMSGNRVAGRGIERER